MTAESLACQLIDRCNQTIDASLRQRARLHVLDWIGCVYGAARETPALSLHELRLRTGSTPSFGLGRLDYDAAFTYSTALGNVLEMDDLARTAIVHPGPVVVPAALYTALQNDSDYGTLLEALVRGYEAAIRLGNSLDAFHYQRWHPTSTAGVGGSAIASAAICALDNTQQLSALCNALSVSGGLWHTRHGNSMTKQWHSVHTARTGMAAAQAARYGFSAAEHIIEGEQGWHRVLAAHPSADEITVDADWAILKTSFKPWPACRHCHPAIDAALMLRETLEPNRQAEAESIAVADIAAITVDTYHDAKVFCDRISPTTAAEARFSLHHSIAVALCNGTVLPRDFEAEALPQANIAHLRQLTTVNSCPQLTANYPAHFGSTVSIALKNGATIKQEIIDAMGDPEWPLSADQIRKKYAMLCNWGIGDCTQTTDLGEAVLNAPENIKVSKLLEAAP